MATTTMSIRMDADLKKRAEELCAEMGMSMTTALTIFLKKMVRERGIPFAVSGGPSLYDEPNISHLRRAKAEMEAGHGVDIQCKHHYDSP